MGTPEEPGFLAGTFLWDENGYRFRADPPIELLDRELLSSSNPWLVLASSLEFAKAGDHRPIQRLLGLAESAASGGLVQASLGLVGDAGLRQTALQLEQFMASAQPSYVRVKACAAALHAGYLELARPMLNTWKDIQPRERASVSLYLSWLLEEEFAEISAYEGFEDDSEYVEVVEERISSLEVAFGPNAVVFRGHISDVDYLTLRMTEILESDIATADLAGEFVHLRRRFEAQTGVDCRRFFRNGTLQRKLALFTVKQFREEGLQGAFEEGRRYFFDHVIPDRAVGP